MAREFPMASRRDDYWEAGSNWIVLYVILLLIPVVFICIAVYSVWSERREKKKNTTTEPWVSPYQPRPFELPEQQLDRMDRGEVSLPIILETRGMERLPFPLPHPSCPCQDN
jgi:hypothetical protein